MKFHEEKNLTGEIELKESFRLIEKLTKSQISAIRKHFELDRSTPAGTKVFNGALEHLIIIGSRSFGNLRLTLGKDENVVAKVVDDRGITIKTFE